MSAPLSPHEILLQGLVRVHAALRRSLATIVSTLAHPIPDGDRAAFAEFSERFAHFLHTHHDGEEKIVFPTLNKAADRTALPECKAHVAGWLDEHEQLMSHLRDFRTACAQFRSGGPQEPLARAAQAVRNELIPHLDAEEATLNSALLAKLLSVDQLTEVARESANHGRRVGGPKSLMLFVHGLTDEEQRAQFSEFPWVVRKVLIKQVWSRGFRECLKYAHNPSVAL